MTHKIDIEKLKSYIEENPNENVQNIANHFKVAYSTIYIRIKQYNLKYKNKVSLLGVTKVNVEQVKKYIEENPRATIKQIAEHFKVAYRTTDGYIKRYNLNYIKNSHKLNKDILQAYINTNKGATVKQIAEYFKVHHITIYKCIKRYNLNYIKNRHRLNKDILQAYINKNKWATVTQIANHFKFSYTPVYRCIKRYNLNYIKKSTNGKIK